MKNCFLIKSESNIEIGIRSRKTCFFFVAKNEVINMCKRHDNTNKSSEFICLRCLSKNQVGDKMRRPNMREKDHVKNLCCLCTKL